MLQEIELDRSELLFMLSAVRATSVIGLNAGELWPLDGSLRQNLVRSGEDSLFRRGLLLVSNNGSRVLDLSLTAMITAITDPNTAVIVTRNLHKRGPQLFILYQSGNVCVEHTMPTANTHRLVLLGEPSSLVLRMRELFADTPANGSDCQYEIAQEEFFDIVRRMGDEDHQRAREQLTADGFSAGDADSFLKTLALPDLEATIAMVQCKSQRITDARDIAVATHNHTMWIFRQQEPGIPRMLATSAGQTLLDSLLQQYHHELITTY